MTPTYDTDLEERIIGTLLSSEDALIELNQFLRPFHFYTPELSDVYGIMEGLYTASKGVSYSTVLSEARRLKKAEISLMYVTNLSQKYMPPSQLDQSAKLLVEYYMRRELMNKLPEICLKASDTRRDVFEVLNEADKVIATVRDTSDRNDNIHASVGVTKAQENYLLAKNSDGFVGLKTGIKSVDEITKGLKKKSNVVIAARPGQGKSLTMMQIAKQNAILDGIPTAIFSLEMGSEELISRLVADYAQVDYAALLEGRLNQKDESKIEYAYEVIAKAPLYIDDTASLNSNQFRSKVKRLVRKHKIQLVIHDFIQLRKGEGKEIKDVVSESSRTDKLVAKENDIVVIDLSQLNREVEKRTDKVPQLSDLKETGSIEENADIVIFLVRPYSYGIDFGESGESLENRIKFIIAKNRNGRTGHCWAWYYGNTQSIKNEDRNATQYPGNPFGQYEYSEPKF